jgi:DNA-binding NtrC family response regulator
MLGELYDRIQKAANAEANLLLTGETGTGKSHVARAIHDLSPRRDKPFVVVSGCGVSSALLQSQLFGHVPGALAGADLPDTVQCAVASEGTILLDEIDCMPPQVQHQMLRVLDLRTYQPVGSERTFEVQARVVAAANRPLDRQVADGKFLPGLFQRLNQVEIRLPPLRNCSEAIPVLAKALLADCCARMGRTISGISVPAQAALRAYHWPGNARELRNAIERAAILCRRNFLDLADLPDRIRRSASHKAGVTPLDPNPRLRSFGPGQEPMQAGES